VNYDRVSVERRYDKLASRIKFFEWLLCVPTAFRKRAAESLGVKEGARILEIGCGTGLNLGHLRSVVGETGRVYGVDLSGGMLGKARELCEREGWNNVTLAQSDALAYTAPEPLDGVVFGLSYNTMPHHQLVLRHALSQLKPGGRIVIMDGKAPPGLLGRITLPIGAWLMKRTLLGNPYIHAWEHLANVVDDFEMEEFLFGSFYICHGTKQIGVARRPVERAHVDAVEQVA
jgi:ubiquinone/menaquinone biosynthesis C-methylase UbiE